MFTNEVPTVTVTDDSFGKEIEQHAGLAVVDFWATWCGPCRMFGPIIDQIAGEYRQVKVGKLEIDANPQTATRFSVRSVPSLLFFRNGVPVGRVVGAIPKATLQQMMAEFVAEEEERPTLFV